jgi:hypothetical protein
LREVLDEWIRAEMNKRSGKLGLVKVRVMLMN